MADQSIPTDTTILQTLTSKDVRIMCEKLREIAGLAESNMKRCATPIRDWSAEAATMIERLASVSSASAEGWKDTVAFVQEWMMSGDHEPDQWHRDFAAAIDARRPTEQSIFDAINEDCGTDAAAWIIARLAAAATPTPEPVPGTSQAGEVEVEAVARAMCDRVNGVGDYNENIQQRRSGWVKQAEAGIAAYLVATQPATSQEGEKGCRYCGGAGKFQITSSVSDGAWASCFCSRAATPTPPTLSVDLREALEEIEKFGHGDGHGRGYTCADMASAALAAAPTPDHKAAWEALSQPLSWMHDNPQLKQYWGWNLADIANDLIDKAYPGLRSGEIVGTTESTVASEDLLWQAANLVYRIEAAGAVQHEGANFERWKTTARALGPKLRAARAQVQQ